MRRVQYLPAVVGVFILLQSISITGIGETAEPTGARRSSRPTDRVLMIHVTDLFRPHNDPDDHWDLACVFALAHQQRSELLGVLIDYPPESRQTDPDVLAVAQLNRLTGLAVPITIGAPRWIDRTAADNPENEPALRGVRSLLRWLRQAPRPVVISVLGSCRDVALAAQLAPDLFQEKCAAVYLNAGSGTPDTAKAAKLEWNVSLDPRAYAAMFRLPCPVYWMPCFEVVGGHSEAAKRGDCYGTYYRFTQRDIVPALSPQLQNYFAYMFMHGRNERQRWPAAQLQPNWLRYMSGVPNAKFIARIGQQQRNMWCTGGFLYAVGQTVTTDGRVVPRGSTSKPIFTFDPVRVTCSPIGVTKWQPGRSNPQRYIFHVRDTPSYDTAMTAAMRRLLTTLP